MHSRTARRTRHLTIAARRSQTLPSAWRFVADVHDTGLRERWYAPGYDRSAWRAIAVPCVWDSLGEPLRSYEGVAWCACEFDGGRVPRHGRAWLRFGRVFYHCTVWLNGLKLGEHHNGYAPFALDCAAALRPGRNSLVLRIDNRYSPANLPGGGVVEWVQYGGLWDPVSLDICGPLRIDSCAVDALPGEGGGAAASWRVTVASESPGALRGSLVVTVEDGEGTQVVPFECPGRGSVTLRGRTRMPGARAWSPQTPRLYAFRAQLRAGGRRVDTYAARIGARSLAVRDGRILLNGAPFCVKGVNRYEEFGAYGPCPPLAELERDFRLLKAAGVNLIRCHHPVSPAVVDCCDRHGILLMQETPINWWGTTVWNGRRIAQSANVLGPAQEVLEAITARDRNHPSFAVWSLANESKTDSRVGAGVIGKLITRVRAVDPGRLVTFVVSQHCATHRMYERADIVAVNIYCGVFFGRPAERLRDLERLVRRPSAALLRTECRHYPDKAFIVGEYGCCAFAGMHGDAAYTEEMQAAYLRAVWKAITGVARVSGGILWSWADYRHRYNFALHVPYGPYGAVTIDRRPKRAYAALTAMYAGRQP